MSADDGVDLDHVMEHIVGGAGWWQWTRIAFMVLPYMGMSLNNLLHLFTAYTPKHRCRVHGCDESEASRDEEFDRPFLKFAVPMDEAGSNFLK